tara:strand:- start:160 stop:450 length:291 start_codon:yes stop_codon:yes gene_type:complete
MMPKASSFQGEQDGRTKRKLCQVFIGTVLAKGLAAPHCNVGMGVDSPVQVMPEDAIPLVYLAVFVATRVLRVVVMHRHDKPQKLSAVNQVASFQVH